MAARESVAGRVGRFLLLVVSAILVPAALIVVVGLVYYGGIRPFYWLVWDDLPRWAAFTLTVLAMVLVPLALFWLIVGIPRAIGRAIAQARADRRGGREQG